MLDSRYVKLHEALGLGPMWVDKSALAEEDGNGPTLMESGQRARMTRRSGQPNFGGSMPPSSSMQGDGAEPRNDAPNPSPNGGMHLNEDRRFIGQGKFGQWDADGRNVGGNPSPWQGGMRDIDKFSTGGPSPRTGEKDFNEAISPNRNSEKKNFSNETQDPFAGTEGRERNSAPSQQEDAIIAQEGGDRLEKFYQHASRTLYIDSMDSKGKKVLFLSIRNEVINSSEARSAFHERHDKFASTLLETICGTPVNLSWKAASANRVFSGWKEFLGYLEEETKPSMIFIFSNVLSQWTCQQNIPETRGDVEFFFADNISSYLSSKEKRITLWNQLARFCAQ